MTCVKLFWQGWLCLINFGHLRKVIGKLECYLTMKCIGVLSEANLIYKRVKPAVLEKKCGCLDQPKREPA